MGIYRAVAERSRAAYVSRCVEDTGFEEYHD